MTTTWKKGWRKLLMMIGIVLCILLVMVLIVFLFLWWHSPGTIEPFYDAQGNEEENSISEIVRMEIGGMEQGMIIRGRDRDLPVLLFLHGGPGNPEYVLAKEAGVKLEDEFVVCWWEQRGSGMSYTADSESLTLEQLQSDALEVTEYLKTRFAQNRIYLMGHSWGTFLGMHLIHQNPEAYQAYFGIGQISNQLESEQQAYSYMKDALQADSPADVQKLMEHQIREESDITPQYLALRSDLLNKLGNGVFHQTKSKWELLMPIFLAHEYTLSDLYGYARGSFDSLQSPANTTCYQTDLREQIPSVQVPVYFFHGRYDRQVSYELAYDYYTRLDAPDKKFFTFEQSAHSPFLEEPEAFLHLIQELVQQQ